jgi:hypothetical protein
LALLKDSDQLCQAGRSTAVATQVRPRKAPTSASRDFCILSEHFHTPLSSVSAPWTLGGFAAFAIGAICNAPDTEDRITLTVLVCKLTITSSPATCAVCALQAQDALLTAAVQGLQNLHGSRSPTAGATKRSVSLPPAAVQIHAGREAIGQKPRKLTCTFSWVKSKVQP